MLVLYNLAVQVKTLIRPLSFAFTMEQTPNNSLKIIRPIEYDKSIEGIADEAVPFMTLSNHLIEYTSHLSTVYQIPLTIPSF